MASRPSSLVLVTSTRCCGKARCSAWYVCAAGLSLSSQDSVRRSVVTGHADELEIGEIRDDLIDAGGSECMHLLELLCLQIEPVQRVVPFAFAHARQIHRAVVRAEATRHDALVAESFQVEAGPLAVGLRLPADRELLARVPAERKAHVLVVIHQQARTAEWRHVELLLVAAVDVEAGDQRLGVGVEAPAAGDLDPRILDDEDVLRILLERAQQLGRRIAGLALLDVRIERALPCAIAVQLPAAAAVAIDREDFAGRRRPDIGALALRDRVDQPRGRDPVVFVDLAVLRCADAADDFLGLEVGEQDRRAAVLAGEHRDELAVRRDLHAAELVELREVLDRNRSGRRRDGRALREDVGPGERRNQRAADKRQITHGSSVHPLCCSCYMDSIAGHSRRGAPAGA